MPVVLRSRGEVGQLHQFGHRFGITVSAIASPSARGSTGRTPGE
jgi:hypothetical protein